MKHTKEPWEVYEDCPRIASGNARNVRKSTYGTYESNSLIDDSGEFFNPADARRIIACVNACAGVPNEILEDVNSSERELLHHFVAMKNQRDELLAALKDAHLQMLPYPIDSDYFLSIIKKAEQS